MHFADLTPYSYLAKPPYAPEFVRTEPWPQFPLLNIGWLEPGYPYTQGLVSDAFIDALMSWRDRYPVHETRGFHQCGYCHKEGKSEAFAQEFRRASKEFRILGNGCVYAVPFLLPHYVSVHDYQPPSEFIMAVGTGPPSSRDVPPSGPAAAG
ncbi:DUF7919 family protein [Streptomyces cinereoruber]